MHTLRNRVLFFGSALMAGYASLVLHRYMLEHCIDADGLLITGNLPGKLLWVIGIGFVVCLTAMLQTIGGDGTYADNFPRCLLSGTLMLTAGGLLLSAVDQLGLVSDESAPVMITVYTELVLRVSEACMAVLPWAAGAGMMVLGVYRMAGKKPPCIFSGIICLFYMLMLVNNYRLWSADPKLHEYAYPLLAGVLLMLCSFHRTCCDAGIIQRKKLLLTGLTAAVCSMASLSVAFMPGFFLASGLWAAGSMCNPAVLPPDPEEEEEETPAPEEEPQET